MNLKRSNLVLIMVALVLALAFALTGCKQDTNKPGDTPDKEVTPVEKVQDKPAKDVKNTSEQPEATAEDETPLEEPVKPKPVTPKEGVETNCVMYFVNNDAYVTKVKDKVVSAGLTPEALMKRLLEGPTEEQKKEGLSTAIPAGTKLNGISMDETVCRVDLSKEFAEGSGSANVTNRVAQVVYTLTQLQNVEAVQFAIDGKDDPMIGGEGLELDGPQPKAYWSDCLAK